MRYLGTLLLFSVLATSFGDPPRSLEQAKEWQEWKITYRHHGHSPNNSTSLDDHDDMVRYKTWAESRNFVANHNRRTNWTFTLATNHLADTSDEEYRTLYTGLLSYTSLSNQSATFSDGLVSSNGNSPLDMDWRTANLVTSVKDQGSCGCCYAFSAVGALEGQVMKAGIRSRSLSPQQILDCSGDYGNNGCNGGLMTLSYSYLQMSEGITADDEYPYLGKMNSCKDETIAPVAKVTGFKEITPFESQLKAAVASIGPISVGIDASLRTFKLYNNGTYYDPLCSSKVLNHAVLIVGYGGQPPNEYWIIKNSWGTSWGMKGYMHLARNMNNHCGVATLASYPTLIKIEDAISHLNSSTSTTFSQNIMPVTSSTEAIIASTTTITDAASPAPSGSLSSWSRTTSVNEMTIGVLSVNSSTPASSTTPFANPTGTMTAGSVQQTSPSQTWKDSRGVASRVNLINFVLAPFLILVLLSLTQ